MPHKARKLLALYGTRYRVHLPPEDPADQVDEGVRGTHESPVRHWVPGFFRRQPYGPGNSLRKITFVRSFWRGKDAIR